MSTWLELGTSEASRAVELDRSGDYEAAGGSYIRAVELLMKASQGTPRLSAHHGAAGRGMEGNAPQLTV